MKVQLGLTDPFRLGLQLSITPALKATAPRNSAGASRTPQFFIQSRIENTRPVGIGRHQFRLIPENLSKFIVCQFK